jgi:hypothetical protein
MKRNPTSRQELPLALMRTPRLRLPLLLLPLSLPSLSG